MWGRPYDLGSRLTQNDRVLAKANSYNHGIGKNLLVVTRRRKR
jgi:hypothetical protein